MEQSIYNHITVFVRPLLAFFLLLALPLAGRAQWVTDEQYQDALKTIAADATYRILTYHNGWEEAPVPYYLTDDGRLTDQQSSAGKFTFRQIEGYDLFRSPGWQVDQCFTNPNCQNGQTEWMHHYGYIRTNAGSARPNWEGQVWYRQGDVYAVRATNSVSDSWGANSFWTVLPDTDDDGLPNADYSLDPLFTWRLEQIETPIDPIDPSEKEVQRLTNIPHVYINTFNGRSITSKTSYVLARMWYVDENDQVTFYDSLQIRGRGNATWGLAKKPYKLKFKEKTKLLGKGYAKAKKWTLLANHGDKSLIRNALTRELGEYVGLPFNPAAQFVDLTFNDAYVGNYQFSDQVDVRPHRVELTEQDAVPTETSDVSGGYLFEADGSGDFHTSTYWDNEAQANLNPDGFYSTLGSVPIRIHYPESDCLQESQIAYAKDFIAEFENRLYGADFTSPTSGYRPYVDSLTLANWYLCTEISGNVDGLYSTYFYKERQDNRIFWGPLWDYDIAYNNDNRYRAGTDNTERQLMKDAGYGKVTSWMQRMYHDPWFTSLIGRRYRELLDGDVEGYLNTCIDSLTTLLSASVEQNYLRWKIDARTLRERVLYSTYDEYIEDLRAYIHNHLAFLEEAFQDYMPEPNPDPNPDPDPDPEAKTPDFNADPDLYYVITNSGTGTCVDVDMNSDEIICNARDTLSESQLWRIVPLSNGYLYVLNRVTGQALNDPTEGEPTATTLVGTTFNTVRGDSTDLRQQWDFVAQSGERFNLINRFSQHAANLSGGSAADGTPVLSYTNNERNATSANRLWQLSSADTIAVVEPYDDVDPLEIDYALAYDPASGRLHFGADDLTQLRFHVHLIDAAGHLVRTFPASEGITLADLPRGLYLVSWKWGDRQHTVKLVR
ncbi:MAG: CotH kinase family protein [Bacteroidaceae bacterium]|nr:CotH kinase family protein [Bacteroidaceae bacterium]